MAGRCDGGGIAALLDLLEEHPAAFAYDWRTRFHLGLDCIPETMGWVEAVGHVRLLSRDPSSMIAAAMQGWDHPITREAVVLMDLFDLMHAANSDPKHGRPDPHTGRPWRIDNRDSEHIGDTAGRSRAEVVTYLNSLGHHLPA